MAQYLRIYRVEFKRENITAASIHSKLQTYSIPIALGNNEFIVAIRLAESDFNIFLSIYYSDFAILRVEAEDQKEYMTNIWNQIMEIIQQANNNNINVDF